MVSASVIAALYVSAAVLLVAPILLLLILCLRGKIDPKPMFLGAGAFFVSQICLRIPILQALSSQGWFHTFALNTIPYTIFLSVTAGLFEESARYVCARFLLRKNRALRDAAAFGLGHGFCEVILLVGLTQVNNIIYASMINSGTFQAMTKLLPGAAGKQILSALLALTPALILVSIWERVSTVLFHLFATVLIFQGVRKRRIGYYFIAVGMHALTDFGSVSLAKYGNIWISEIFLSIIALAGVFYIWKAKATFTESAA